MYIAKPKSKSIIRSLAHDIRRRANINLSDRVDILRLLEHQLHELIPGATYEVVPDEELPGEYAKVLVGSQHLLIREDVYNRASEGNPRDRFTIAHEIGHLFMHEGSEIRLSRRDEPIKKYMCPEWQANTFAAELLAPSECCTGKSTAKIAAHFGVSNQVAMIQSNS